MASRSAETLQQASVRSVAWLHKTPRSGSLLPFVSTPVHSAPERTQRTGETIRRSFVHDKIDNFRFIRFSEPLFSVGSDESHVVAKLSSRHGPRQQQWYFGNVFLATVRCNTHTFVLFDPS